MATSENRTPNCWQMFSKSKAVMLLIDPSDGTIIDASLGASQYYGYSLSELKAMSIFDINTSSKAEIAVELQRAEEESKNYFNFHHQLASKEVRDVEVYSNPLSIDGQKFLHFIIHDITERKRMEDRLKYLATHDSLTGLYNRNMLEQRITDEVNRAERYNHALSVFMVDIDYFKLVNDTYGHRIGDTVLSSFASILESSIRKTDYAARYGGEEFIVILPETPLAKAAKLAKRLHNQLAEHPIQIEDDKELNLTTSIGVAAFPEHAQSWQNLLEAGDLAMYAAKKAGRNQTKCFEW